MILNNNKIDDEHKHNNNKNNKEKKKDDKLNDNNDKKKKKINLLKIDVERYELSVLRGIREEDFAHIETIVVEVHDKEDKTGVKDVVALLKSRGKFPRVIVEQPEHLKGSMLFNVFAFR